MKLSDYAKQVGVQYRTAWNWIKAGKLEHYRTPSGCICVKNKNDVTDDYTVVYCRVSSSENKPNLDSQAKRVCEFCQARGWVVNEIIKECGSGINDSRPKLEKIFTQKRATRIVVEHKDRLTRFGFNYIKNLADWCEIVVINEAAEDEEDLIQDFISFVTSYCTRIYGKRRSKQMAETLIKNLNSEDVGKK
jgi:predicted site-specific integrase-resolvase